MTNFKCISENEIIKLASERLLNIIEEYEIKNEEYELIWGETSKRYDRLLSILNKQYSELHDYLSKGGDN